MSHWKRTVTTTKGQRLVFRNLQKHRDIVPMKQNPPISSKAQKKSKECLKIKMGMCGTHMLTCINFLIKIMYKENSTG